MITPWGPSTRIIELEPGIRFVLARHHGGLIMDRDYAERNLSFPARKRALGFGDFYAYEMDCAWAVPMWELPHLWKKLGEEGREGMEELPERHLAALISRRYPDYLLEYRCLKSYRLCRPLVASGAGVRP